MKPILFVEDNHDDIWIAKRAIKTARIRIAPQFVVSYPDFKRYMEGYGGFSNRQNYPIPCLIFVDLKLEASSGFDVLIYLAGHDFFRTLPAIVLTSSGIEEDRMKAMQLGAKEFITKPYNTEQLGGVLVKVLQDHLPSEESAITSSLGNDYIRIDQQLPGF